MVTLQLEPVDSCKLYVLETAQYTSRRWGDIYGIHFFFYYKHIVYIGPAVFSGMSRFFVQLMTNEENLKIQAVLKV